jgi:hypothetical protein
MYHTVSVANKEFVEVGQTKFCKNMASNPNK